MVGEVRLRRRCSHQAFDDPCVQDELALPTIAAFKNGDNPSAEELAISGDYSKTITENLGVSVGERWIHLRAPVTRSQEGFANLGTGFKYQFVSDAEGELAMSAALAVVLVICDVCQSGRICSSCLSWSCNALSNSPAAPLAPERTALRRT